MTARSLEINVNKISGAQQKTFSDRVAAEEPLEIRLGYSTPQGRTATSVSITMRTPGHDVELAPASHRSTWQNEFAERAEKQGRITETN